MCAIQTMFTGKDNSSVDIGRVLWALSTVVFLALAVFAVCIRGATFDPMTVAGALAAMSVGHGATLRVKDDTEPEAKP